MNLESKSKGELILELKKLQDKFTASENKFNSLFNSSSTGILLLKNGEIIDCNQKAEELFCGARKQLLGRKLDEFQADIPSKDQKLGVKLNEGLNIVRDGEQVTLKTRLKTFKGSRFFEAELTFEKVNWEGNECIQIFLRNIPKDKKGQILTPSIENSENKKNNKKRGDFHKMLDPHVQQMLDNTSFYVMSLSVSGEICFCNKSGLNALGYSKSELMNQNFHELLVDQVNWIDSKNNLKQILQGKRSSDVAEASLRTKKGNFILARYSVLEIHKNEGEIVGVTLAAENISQEGEIRKTLKKRNAQLREIFDTSNELIQFFSADYQLSFANKAWKQKMGYKGDEVSKLNLKDIIHPDFLDFTKIQLEKIGNGQEIGRFKTCFINKYGRSIDLSGKVNCSKADGKVVEFRGVLNDITEQTKVRRALKASYNIADLVLNTKGLENFYASIHRELKNVIPIENYYIALVDEAKTKLNFPYYIDENYPEVLIDNERVYGKGLTEFAMRTQRPLLLYEEDIVRLQEQKEVIQYGPLPRMWMGVPLRLGTRTIGVIAVQSYHEIPGFDYKDLELLDFISSQVAMAIEKKQKENKINKQTARLKAIFESESHYIWSVDRSFKLTSLNENFKRIFQRIYGLDPLEIHDSSRKITKLFGKWRRYFLKAFEGNAQHFEAQMKDKENRDVWLDIFLNPVFGQTKGSKSTVQEVSGIALEVTEKKKAALAVRESEEKYRNIFESFQDLYFTCCPMGAITTVSPSILELMGYRAEEVMNKNITDYYLYNKKTKNLIRKLLKKKSVRNFEASLIRKDGQIIQCICNIRLIYDKENHPIAIEGVAREITTLKQINEELMKAKEVAENSLKVKEQFLANMSHEIRTPMNGIIGMIDLINSTFLNEDQKRYVQTIKKSSETLLHILNDILDLSKIEAGKMTLKKSPVPLRSVIEKIEALFSQQAVVKNITIKTNVNKDVPEFIMVDETRLLQVFSNLTSNAIKFTEGGGRVSISLKVNKKKGNLYLLKGEVKDSGIGISETDVSKLFSSFTQLDTSSSKSYVGTGLGLAITKELCHLMNGNIGVSSTLGVGSTFWFTFEAEKTDKIPLIKELSLKEGMANKDFFGDYSPKILLVDDNQINRQVAGEILKSAGCQVDLAVGGWEAIDRLTKASYDVIFMDIQMPVMDGVETVKRIRQLNIPNLAPIIAMTAYAMQEDRNRFLQEGMDDYLAKPIKAMHLINKVRTWLVKGKKDKSRVERNPNEEGEKINLGNRKTIKAGNSSDSFQKEAFKEEIKVKRKEKEEKVIGIVPAHKNDEFPEETEQVINQEIIQQLEKFVGKEQAISTMEDFAKEAEELIRSSFSAFKNENYKEILNILHTLKGNAGTLGVDQLAAYARRIEADVKEGRLKHLEKNLLTLSKAFETFKNYFFTPINH
ncbi:PAS domain S-box protein [Xanthovirga aplysinae]|uniref:PAS domain S-box protein n=1 Tax=Xanthovirga aplysinae TaxID=2529853 RepID=UPI0012BB4C00|nr:PAS domain S-box protein [Xanthovirga aplysinae]MTI30565.1 PAS domain S-box protein [Xanthovirga aplysinae]